MSSSGFNSFTIQAKASWYSETLSVKYFSYMMTQYLPTVYANIVVYINKDDFNDFKSIDKLPISNRTIELWFQPSLELNGTEYFSGNYKFVCTNMEYQGTGLADNVADENTTSGIGYFVCLHCIDKVYYKMTLDKKYAGYNNQTISNVVKTITSNNGGSVGKIIDTDYKYNWLQTQMTDAEMLRSLLPYARSSNKELMYNITFLNEKCYFVPITYGFSTNEKIIIDFDKTNTTSFNITDSKPAIERFASQEKLYCVNHGYTNFEYIKSETLAKQAYISNSNSTPKQHGGVATQYISTTIEDETLSKIYASNVRQRVNMFNVMLEMSVSAIPDIMCYNVIELINQESGTRQTLDNLYYILAIKYEYYGNNAPSFPTMHLCLSSEFDYSGTTSAEGTGISG